MDDLHPTKLELEERILGWLGGSKGVPDRVALQRARDNAVDRDRGNDGIGFG